MEKEDQEIKKILIIVEGVLFGGDKNKLHSPFDVDNYFADLKVTLSSREKLLDKQWVKMKECFSLKKSVRWIAPADQLLNIGDFDYICGTQSSIKSLWELNNGQFKPDTIFFNIMNLWDTNFEEVEEELSLPIRLENVIGIRAVAHRLDFLSKNLKEEEIKYIGVFGADGWLQKMYRKQGFTNDFENFKTVPIYPSGAYK